MLVDGRTPKRLKQSSENFCKFHSCTGNMLRWSLPLLHIGITISVQDWKIVHVRKMFYEMGGKVLVYLIVPSLGAHVRIVCRFYVEALRLTRVIRVHREGSLEGLMWRGNV